MKDAEFFNWLWPKVKSTMSGKVDKVKGKGLSTNDFTTEEKIKLANDISCTAENVRNALGINSGSAFLREDGTWADPTETIPESDIDILFKEI